MTPARLTLPFHSQLLATDPPYLVDYDGGERAATKGNKGRAK
jgi:hypothetical protein